MDGNKKAAQLITAEEAVELSAYITEDTLIAAKKIVNEWQKQFPCTNGSLYCLLAAIYEAGRIQGKREERRRRHGES